MPKLTVPYRLALTTLLLATLSAPAQTLARPGWAGSGMTAASWWHHAIVYQTDPRAFGGLHSLAGRLDYIHSLGADALLLTPLSSAAAQTASTSQPTEPAQPIDPALGSLDDLDDLVRRASELSIRVIVTLDPHAAGSTTPSPDLASTTRLWLTHGIAGFYAPEASTDQIASLRSALGSFAGQRILIGDLNTSGSALELLADPGPGTVEQLTASAVRPALEAAQQMASAGPPVPLVYSDGPAIKRSLARYSDGTHDAEIARAIATILLTTRCATMLYYGQELGLTNTNATISFDESRKSDPPPPASVTAQEASSSSLLNWYRRLSGLAHGNRTISTGDMITLNHDGENVLAWVRRPKNPSQSTPAIVVIENLSAQPVTLSLKADIQHLRLRGTFLRTVLRSDTGMGGMSLSHVTLPPYAVFIGELRY